MTGAPYRRGVLEEIRLRDLGVIEDAVVPLAPGFTAVTGETGAGKTMVVTALHLLFGGRADPALVRAGAARAAVEGAVVVDVDGPAATRAVDAGAELDDGLLLLARTVSAEGRSRAVVGGRSVPVGVLGELADDLIAVHGQSDQQRLLRPALQRALLDRYAGPPVLEPLGRYRDAYRQLQDVDELLTELTGRARERAQEVDLLRHGLAEIARVAPQPGEDAELAAEVGRLAHAEALRAAAHEAHELLSADDGALPALGLVSEARRRLDGQRDHDEALDTLATRVAEISYLLADAAADLASYAASVESDPARLAQAQERQAALAALHRKYGEGSDAVLAWAEQAETRLADLDGADERIDALTGQRTTLRTEIATLAATISAARAAAGERLAGAVTAELSALAMPHAEVATSITQVDDADGLQVGERRVGFGLHGVDEVELLLRPHAGAPLRPLARGASGGELSRVMLAVEVTLAGSDPVPTFVFDEVDAGVGGKAAVEVGRRLAMLARHAQVVVVTHLPQVAAFADRHLVVVKSDDGTVTRSGVRQVDGEERLRELSRMLAGLEESELAIGHAEELLAAATAAKSGRAPS